MARATLKEQHSRVITPISKDKRKNVLTNGVDDNYPERIDLLINNSTTAKLAVNKMTSFIVGKGFRNEELNNRIFNKKKGLTGYDLLVSAAKSVCKQKAITMQVNYNGKLEPDTLDVLPFKNCRKEKDDDYGNSGVWLYSDSWGKSNFSFSRKSKKSKWFYPFNRSKQVLTEQFKADGISFDINKKDNVNTFKGQVIYLNLDPEYEYPLAFIDPAYNDADSEYHSSLDRNNTIKNGYTNKQVVLMREESEDNPNGAIDAVGGMIGSDSPNLAIIEVGVDAPDLTKEIHVVSLGGDVDAEKYKYFDEINERKILQCFENIPEALVLGGNSELFGDSGIKLRQMKLNYSQDTEYIRRAITQMMTKIYPNEDWSIEPLLKEETVINTVENV